MYIFSHLSRSFYRCQVYLIIFFSSGLFHYLLLRYKCSACSSTQIYLSSEHSFATGCNCVKQFTKPTVAFIWYTNVTDTRTHKYTDTHTHAHMYTSYQRSYLSIQNTNQRIEDFLLIAKRTVTKQVGRTVSMKMC